MKRRLPTAAHRRHPGCCYAMETISTKTALTIPTVYIIISLGSLPQTTAQVRLEGVSTKLYDFLAFIGFLKALCKYTEYSAIVIAITTFFSPEVHIIHRVCKIWGVAFEEWLVSADGLLVEMVTQKATEPKSWIFIIFTILLL